MTRLLTRLTPLTLAMGLAAIAMTGVAPSSPQPVAVVTVDIPVTTWTVINSAQPGTSYWTGGYRDSIRVGKNPSDNSVWRGILQAEISSLQGRDIVDARLIITLDHSASCNATPVALHSFSTPISTEDSVTWGNSAAKFGPLLDVRYANANGTGGCGTLQPDYVVSFTGTSLTTALGQAVQQTHPQFTVGLRAPNEANSMEWKKFRHTNITLSVTYLA